MQTPSPCLSGLQSNAEMGCVEIVASRKSLTLPKSVLLPESGEQLNEKNKQTEIRKL